MSRSQNLRHNVINQVIDDMARVISLPHFHRKVRGGNVQHQPDHSVIFSAIYANAALDAGWKRLHDCA